MGICMNGCTMALYRTLASFDSGRLTNKIDCATYKRDVQCWTIVFSCYTNIVTSLTPQHHRENTLRAPPATTTPRCECRPTPTARARWDAGTCRRDACRRANTRRRTVLRFLCESQNSFYLISRLLLTAWVVKIWAKLGIAQHVDSTFSWHGPVHIDIQKIFLCCIRVSQGVAEDPDVGVVKDLIQFLLRVINLEK